MRRMLGTLAAVLFLFACGLFQPNGASDSPPPVSVITAEDLPEAGATAPSESVPASAVRQLPDTWDGIHVFNDQLWLYDNPAWIEFSATHYVGAQKMTRPDADALRAVNPNFVILNYRLGMGLGYQVMDGWETCNFTGEWLGVVEGNDWVTE